MKRSRSAARPDLVVWDFDWSMINENSDTYIIQELDPSGAVWEAARQKHAEDMEWTLLMDWCVGELHARGVQPAQIDAVMGAIPVFPSALSAVAHASAAGADQRILSDANTVYIDRFLAPRPELASAVSTIETNEASYGADGRLTIRAHQPAGRAHGCELCPPNLCKGAVLSRWLEAELPGRCVYVGDGGGDFCPATRLRKGDVLLARRAPHSSLLDLCREQPSRVRATVVEWGGAQDPQAEDLLRGVQQALAGELGDGTGHGGGGGGGGTKSSGSSSVTSRIVGAVRRLGSKERKRK
jgi:2,3-diketo-5-methylthio-1-phosphopentane phosphatase